MNLGTFKGLLSKELRLGWRMFLTVLFFNSLLLVYYWLTFAPPRGAIRVEALFVFLHVVYLSVFLLYSLRKESRQIHQWLYNPQSMNVLLGTKLITGCIYFLLSLIFNILCASCASYVYSLDVWRQILSYSDFVKMSLVSLTLSMYALLLWSILRWLKPILKKWILVILCVVYVYVMFYLFFSIGFTTYGFLYHLGIDTVLFLLSSFILTAKVEIE